MFGVPIALVSLVDAHRQWFKSRQGLDACETGRDISFCGHAILDSETLEVSDALDDPRFVDNPLVLGEPHIRFYAGAPLKTLDGYRVGTLCIIDFVPRRLSDSEKHALRDLADCVEHEFNITIEHHLRSMLQKSETRNAAILRELPDIVILLDKNGCFLESNEHPDMLVPREALLGRCLDDVLPAHLAQRCHEALATVLSTGEPQCFDYQLELPHGLASFEARMRHLGEYQALLVIRNTTAERHAKTELLRNQRLIEAIAGAQSDFIREEDRRRAFEHLLNDILDLTQSEYGFIGEVLQNAEGLPYLKTHAITNIAWNDETLAFYEHHALQGLEFTNLQSLFGAALTSGEPVIANDPAHDPRRGGLPEGHPALNAFLGIPIQHGGKLVAMLGIANRPDGYDQAIIQFLSPLLISLGQLVVAARVQQQHLEDQQIMLRLSRVASQTTNGVIITDIDGRVEWINEGFTRISGYRLDDMRGRKPGDVLQGPDTDPATVAEIRSALAQQQGFSVDLLNYHHNGRPYWIRITCNPLFDADKKLQGFIAVESDISREKQDAERVRASERRLASVIEGTNIGTWEWNLQTGETIFNERWAEIVGYTLEELAPTSITTWMELAHPDDLAVSGQRLEKHFAGELPFYEFTARMRHKKGHWVWVHDRGRVVSWTADGKPLLMTGTHADVTEQKHASESLQASEARLRALFELSPIGIALNDYETGNLIDLNEALLRPSGYSREEFFALSYWDLTPRDYEAQEAKQLESLHKIGHYGPYEKEYIRKDGSRYPVLLSGMLVDDSSGRKLIWSIIEDISERKRIERMKNEFISTVSHELRTPLTSISGALGLIAGGALGELSPQAHSMIAIAYKNSQRLGYLINDLLDMEKLMAGKIRFDLCVQPLQPLLEQAIQDNRAYADQFNVRLRLSHGAGKAQVRVDAQRLQQVLANLLSNAAKFSPADTEVVLYAQQLDGQVRVVVRDHGPGIPTEFHDHIFEKFAQADASDTRKKGGSGLGLAITRELVERMSGTIGFDSVPGAGASFWFELPISGNQAEESACA
ncbi:MAG: PAS domain S-box protein [Thiohalomonadaceae bacterium]